MVSHVRDGGGDKYARGVREGGEREGERERGRGRGRERECV